MLKDAMLKTASLEKSINKVIVVITASNTLFPPLNKGRGRVREGLLR